MSRTDVITRQRSGVTLIELMIVVLIIAVIGAAGTPTFFRSLSFHRAESAAQRIKVDLELARQRAKTASASQSLEFRLGSHAYVMPGVPHLDHPLDTYQVDLQGPPYRSTIVSASFGGDEIVIFDGFGILDSGGAVIVQSGQFQKTISLDPDTGKARVQ